MSQLISVLFQVTVTILLIKLYHDLFIKKLVSGKKSTSWSEASIAMEKMEHRLTHLQEREISAQERIWQLEDENRVLKGHVQQLRAISFPKEPEPDDDEEDEPRTV